MPADDTPRAEVHVDDALVRRLLGEQAPDLADRPLARLAEGWDNVVYRLGDAHTVRLPRRAVAAALVGHEQRWLPALAPRLPLPVPEPVVAGRPGHGYPWPWSVCRWVPGRPALHEPPTDAVHAARTLGRFLRALHRPAPPDAPVNPWRGGPLAERDGLMAERLAVVADLLDVEGVRSCWAEAVAVPAWSGPPVWLHGDVHPGNLLVQGGELAGVVDFGDLTGGDPATDLGVAWMLLPPAARAELRAAAGDVDDATWARARGWALAVGIAILASSAGDAAMRRLGQETIAAVLADRA